MSQNFIIKTVGNLNITVHNIGLHKITDSDELIQGAIKKIDPSNYELYNYYLVNDLKFGCDYLFTEAQNSILQGKEFKLTRLYKIVKEAIDNKSILICWYSNYTDTIDTYSDESLFIKDLQKAISKSTCEFYGMYIGNNI